MSYVQHPSHHVSFSCIFMLHYFVLVTKIISVKIIHVDPITPNEQTRRFAISRTKSQHADCNKNRRINDSHTEEWYLLKAEIKEKIQTLFVHQIASRAQGITTSDGDMGFHRIRTNLQRNLT